MQLGLDFGGEDERSVEAVRDRLEAAFGAPAPLLRRDPVSQLVRSIISARTEDAVSDLVLARLRERFRSWDRLADARIEEVLPVVRPATFPEDKAERLPRALRLLRGRVGALRLDGLADLSVNDALAWLQELPGVGQKTAASVLNFSTLDRRVMVVDGHVQRTARRLGLAAPEASAGEVRESVMACAPDAWEGGDFARLHRLLKHLGRTFCRPAGPDCAACPMADGCPDRALRRSQDRAAGRYAPANENKPETSGAGPSAWLRRRVERIERRGVGASGPVGCMGHPALDAAFTGGGPPPGLHQAAPATPGDLAAPWLPALAVSLGLAGPGPGAGGRRAGRNGAVGSARVLLVAEADALREGGAPYGPGLDALGLPSAQSALVRVSGAADALRVAEEAVRLRAAPAVWVELRRGAALADLAATRRLDLAARRAGVFVFLLTPDLLGTSAAVTRWRVGSAPTVSKAGRGAGRRLGSPAFHLALVRNRAGRTGDWLAEWSAHERRFETAAPLPAPMDAPVVDRPRPAVAGGARA